MTAAARRWWQQRDARERTLLGVAVALVLAALLWTLALAPALKTLRQHGTHVQQLQSRLAQMQALQAQANSLQAGPPLDAAAAQQALQTHTTALLGAQASLSGHAGGATVTLRAASPQALGRWLATIRTEAHARVVASRLQRQAEGWSGTVQLALPE